jgi:hypothetical protein
MTAGESLIWRRAGLRREPLALTVGATTRADERLWIAPGVASNYGRCWLRTILLGACIGDFRQVLGSAVFQWVHAMDWVFDDRCMNMDWRPSGRRNSVTDLHSCAS